VSSTRSFAIDGRLFTVGGCVTRELRDSPIVERLDLS